MKDGFAELPCDIAPPDPTDQVRHQTLACDVIIILFSCLRFTWCCGTESWLVNLCTASISGDIIDYIICGHYDCLIDALKASAIVCANDTITCRAVLRFKGISLHILFCKASLSDVSEASPGRMVSTGQQNQHSGLERELTSESRWWRARLRW